MAHYHTPSAGGAGAARDAVEYILKAQGSLEKVIDAYIYARKIDPVERGFEGSPATLCRIE